MWRKALSIVVWLVGLSGVLLKGGAQDSDPPISGSCYVFFPPDGSHIQYTRRTQLIWEITPTSAMDFDIMPWGIAENYVVLVGWKALDGSGNEVGGEFGYTPDGHSFYPVSDPEQVNCFRPRPDFVGVLKIAPVLDDIPIDIYLGMPTHDDPRTVGDPWKMTVWEFEIDPPYTDALPQDGATYDFTATIRPAVDHLGNSMARIIEFGLVSSSEPGYCLNASREEGQWMDTSAEDNDLKFLPNQAGFEVYAEETNPTNYCHARTTTPVHSATVQVRCLDYGAYGSIWAYAYGLGLARWKGTLIERGAQIPLDQRDGLDNDGDGRVDEDLLDLQDNDGDGRVDEDAQGNYIYDGWQWNDGAATDDNDLYPSNQLPPANQPRLGDGISRYEEYRGFIVQGSHQRLNPNLKDVFIYNPHNLDISGFTTLGFQVHLMQPGEFEAIFDVPTDNDDDRRVDEDPLDGVDNDGDGQFDEDPADSDYPRIEYSTFVVNPFWKTANVMIQRCIAVLYLPTYLEVPLFQGSLPLGVHRATLPGRPPLRAHLYQTNPLLY